MKIPILFVSTNVEKRNNNVNTNTTTNNGGLLVTESELSKKNGVTSSSSSSSGRINDPLHTQQLQSENKVTSSSSSSATDDSDCNNDDDDDDDIDDDETDGLERGLGLGLGLGSHKNNNKESISHRLVPTSHIWLEQKRKHRWQPYFIIRTGTNPRVSLFSHIQPLLPTISSLMMDSVDKSTSIRNLNQSSSSGNGAIASGAVIAISPLLMGM